MELVSADAASWALLMGTLAAFNPCGFALLPAYITLIVTGSADARVTRPEAIARAIGFGTAMTVGFVAVFMAFGFLFAGVSYGLQGDILPYVSYVTVVLGVLLVALGVHLLRGGELTIPGVKVAGAAPSRTFLSQVVYGAAFAIASLSCTIGPFLAVVTTSLEAPNPIAAGLPFVIYGIGMGSAVLTISLLAATAGNGAVAALRRHQGLIMRITAVVMVLAGLYVLAYGLAEVFQAHTDWAWVNRFILANGEVQGDVQRWIQGVGPTALAVFATVVVLGTIGLWVWTRIARSRAGEAPAPAPATTRAAAGKPAIDLGVDVGKGAKAGTAAAKTTKRGTPEGRRASRDD